MKNTCRIAPIVLLAMFSLACRVTAQDKVLFNQQIRPILNKHCIACHGPDEGDRQAGLRLDTFDDATEYAIVPGDAEGSDVIDRIKTDDAELRMPPTEHADALKPEEVELLTRWIDQGATYEKHWSFAPIASPKPPVVKSEADQAVRVQNSIDPFILRLVAEAGLPQNSPAAPRRLMRRLSLDLTGLPPSAHGTDVQKVISAYLKDPTPKTYEAVVDGMMLTPAYAEHWASMWLDLARYADTCGYSGDEKRDIWPWRDWLIRSLMANRSYRDMTIEMLAGDLLPEATIDQQLATAFHRNTLANNEGGTNDEEFRTIAVKDRLSTTLNVWMGLTVRCAECHSHKYDPISQQEYYQLLDFFNQTVDADNRDDRPKLEVFAQLDPAESAMLNRKIADLQKKQVGLPKIWHTIRPVEMVSRNGTTFEQLKDDSILAGGPLPGTEEYAFTFEAKVGTTIRAIRLEALPHVKHNGNVGRAPEGAFILSQIRFAKVERADGDEGKPETVLPFSKATASFSQVNRHPKNAILADVEPGGNQGWAVNHPVDGYRARQEAIFELEEPFVVNEPSRFKLYLLHDPPWKRLNLGCMRFSVCNVEDPVGKYDKKQLDQINREITNLETKRDSPIRVPVIQERDPKYRRETYINLRGNFQSKGERVSAAFPSAFTFKKDFRLDRLGLAQWLFADDNPLTARVAVNRYWSRIMGQGLVESEEDFGTQGATPTHPELLDHLATKLVQDKWDVRQLLKFIVCSATYQQSQQVDEQALKIDPKNLLYSRGPRVRLRAEVVRDQALAVSGLLSNKMFGKPVYPPSPIKRVVNAFTGGMTWQESTGPDRYRRALYTFLKRSAPHPLFETFDVSSRDVCSMRRIRTNTPLQSFMTLNDITFVEAARALATRMSQADGSSHADENGDGLQIQIGRGIELALFRSADQGQLAVLTKVYLKSKERFAGNLPAAFELTGRSTDGVDWDSLPKAKSDEVVHHASLTVVGNVILNLDAFLNN